MLLLFTTPHCPNCPKAKLLAAEKLPDASLIDASFPEGLNRARKYNVAQVPTLLEINEEGSEIRRFSGIDDIVNFIEN